jgi:hypothetical protein
MHGVEPTLDAWLNFNGVSDVYDAELLVQLAMGRKDRLPKVTFGS